MKLLKLTALTVLASCISLSVHAKNWEDDKTYKLTVLHTNDSHGRFWHNKYGEFGMPARSTMIKKIRKEVKAAGGSVLLLSGGDINTGVPESDLLQAEPDILAMNKMAYDAMAIGNHEFDNPLDVLTQQQLWASFPFLSTNIYQKDKNERMYQPYTIIEKQGLKIAIVGFTAEDTVKIGNPLYLENLDFRDIREEGKLILKELEEDVKPDMIIGLTHIGHYDDGKHGYNSQGDVTLARSLPKGKVTALIGGHSHEAVCMESENVLDEDYKPLDECTPDKQNDIYIMQAYEWGKYIGRADFEFKNGVATLASYKLIPINLKKKVKDAEGKSTRVLIGEEIPHDQEILDLLNPFVEKGKEALEVKVGSTPKLLQGDRDVIRFGQTNLGRLIATAQMVKAKADFGVMNSGGIRASIEPGDITYKEVLTVQPFANTLTYLEMTGKEVIEYLNVVALKPIDAGAFAQFAGISMTVNPDGVTDVKIGGKAIDLEKTYRMSQPNYTASGGDGYPKVTDKESYVDTRFVDADVFKEYLENNTPLKVDTYMPAGEMVYKNQEKK